MRSWLGNSRERGGGWVGTAAVYKEGKSGLNVLNKTPLFYPVTQTVFQRQHDVPACSSEQLLQRRANLQQGESALAPALRKRPLSKARLLQPESQVGGQPPEGAPRWASTVQPAPHVLHFGQVCTGWPQRLGTLFFVLFSFF